MKRFNVILKKLKYPIVAIAIAIAISVVAFIEQAFSVSTSYTRSELQQMIVSAAISYYYNNKYSDYEEYLLDSDIVYPYIGENDVSSEGKNKCILDYKNSTGCVSAGNSYPLVSTTFYRNLEITPEEVSRSNMYNTDCSGFAYLVYNNVLNYDLSEFYALSTTANIVNIDYSKNPVEATKTRAITSKDAYLNVAKKYGRAWNSAGNLARIANCLAANNGNRNSCIFSEALSDDNMKKYNTSEENKNLGGNGYTDLDNKSELIFNYNFENLTYQDETSYTAYKDEWKKIEKYFKADSSDFIMQAGDMLSVSYTSNGHVMVYVGKAFNSNDAGLIHSTGTDGKNDDFSVRYEPNIYNYLNDKMKHFKDDEKDQKRIISISVLRPINKYCDETVCTNEKITDNITSNDKARVAFSTTRVEQYVAKDNRGISSYNSVDVGDTITYGLILEDKRNFGYCSDSSKATEAKCVCDTKNPNCGTKWVKASSAIYNKEPEKKTYTIKFTLPTGTTLKKPELFTKDTNSNNTYSVDYTTKGNCDPEKEVCGVKFEVSINEDARSTIDPVVFEVTYNNITLNANSNLNVKTLKLKTIELNVNRTINSNDISRLNEIINEFKDKNYAYSTSNQISNESSVDKVTSLSSLDFIKYIYLKNFKIDLTNLKGDDIVNSLFYSPLVKGVKEQTYNGTKYNYNVSVFSKKARADDNINKMLVDGMYGGKKLIGNENGERIKYIDSRYFEIGDIIVVSDKLNNNFSHGGVGDYLNYSLTTIDPNTDFKYYIVTDFDKNGYPTLNSFGDNGVEYCNKTLKTFDDEGNYIMNNGYSYMCSFRVIKHLLYSSSLFAVLRPSKVYNDVEYKVVLHYDQKPTTEETPRTNLQFNAKYPAPTISKTGYKFDGWYAELSVNGKGEYVYNKKVTNVNLHTDHEVWAKFSPIEYNLNIEPNGGTFSGTTSVKIAYKREYTLPTVTKEGYTFVKWQVSGKDSSINGNIITMGSEDTTITAVWKENDRLIFDSSLSVDKNNKIIYHVKVNSLMRELLNEISTNGTVVLYDNKNNIIKENHLAATGYIMSFKFVSQTINYKVAVKGDVTGDGYVKVNDVMKIANYLLENKGLNGEYLVAADINSDNKVKINDLMKLATIMINGGSL